MDLYVYILIAILLVSAFINICLVVICYQYKNIIDVLESDSASDYRLILEYQKTITKLNKKIEEAESTKKR